MIANWIHIMVVHLVVIGCPYILFRVVNLRNHSLSSWPWKGNFSLLIVLGILASIAYFTGPDAAEWTKQVLVNYPQAHVEDHGLWGRISFVVQGIAGLVGIMGWASILQEEVPEKRIPVILMVLLAMNTLILLYTAHLGGLVRRMDLMF